MVTLVHTPPSPLLKVGLHCMSYQTVKGFTKFWESPMTEINFDGRGMPLKRNRQNFQQCGLSSQSCWSVSQRYPQEESHHSWLGSPEKCWFSFHSYPCCMKYRHFLTGSEFHVEPLLKLCIKVYIGRKLE